MCIDIITHSGYVFYSGTDSWRLSKWPQVFIFSICAVLTFFSPAAALPTCQGGMILSVSKQESGVVEIFEFDSGDLKNTIPVESRPHEIAISPDQTLAAVSNYGGDQLGNSITIIDLSSAKAVTTLSLEKFLAPHGVVWLDQSRLAVTVENAQAVVIVDVKAESIERVIQLDQEATHMIVAYNNALYVSNIISGTVSFISLEDQKIKHVDAGKGSEDLAILPDGTEIWVANQEGMSISIIDTHTGSRIFEFESIPFPVRIESSPNGEFILVSTLGDDALRIFNAKNKQLIRTVSLGVGSAPADIAVLPDNDCAIVSLTYRNELAVVDLRSGTIIRRIKTKINPDGIAYVK